jgi:transposase
MQLRTTFNRLQKFKGFVSGKINWSQGEELALDVHIRPQRGSRPVCSVCGCKGAVYDTQEARRFEFVPILQIAVFFVYRMPRVDCRHCERVVTETVRRHQPLLLNWFKANGELPGGAVEGLNGKARLSMRKAYGYKSFDVAQIALFHTLGQLPTTEFTHKFW